MCYVFYEVQVISVGPTLWNCYQVQYFLEEKKKVCPLTMDSLWYIHPKKWFWKHQGASRRSRCNATDKNKGPDKTMDETENMSHVLATVLKMNSWCTKLHSISDLSVFVNIQTSIGKEHRCRTIPHSRSVSPLSEKKCTDTHSYRTLCQNKKRHKDDWLLYSAFNLLSTF